MGRMRCPGMKEREGAGRGGGKVPALGCRAWFGSIPFPVPGAAFWRGSVKGLDKIILLTNAAFFLSSVLLLNMQFVLCLMVRFSFLHQTSATGFSFFFFFPFGLMSLILT